MNWTALLNSLIFAIFGLLVFCVGFFVIDKLTPYDLWQELVEKKNTAVAIVVGLVAIGISLIIAAAVHG